MLIDDIIEILSQENVSLTDALLKTKILLYQIGKKELVEWVNNELNGYPNLEAVPPYRIVPSEVVGHIVNARFQAPSQPIPIGHLTQVQRESLEKVKIDQPLAVLEEYAAPKKGVIKQRIPMESNGILEKGLASDFRIQSAWREISVQSIKGILVHVRSHLLDFLLELRDKVGEGATDINIKEKSNSFDATNLFNQAIFGAHATIIVGHDIVQTVSFDSESISNLRDFLQQLRGLLPQSDLVDEAKEQAEVQIDTVEIELAKPRPNFDVIKTAGNILYGLLLGVGGNLATDLLKHFAHF